ncbi:RHS repeat protein, partial [bacterium]|nr:RHS repeat protein [bacterium]
MPGSNTWVTGKYFSILALGSGGQSTVLRPGQTETMTVKLRVPFRPEPVQIILSSLGASADDGIATAIDFTQVEAEVRPEGLTDAQWTPIWANLKSRMGQTWGDYVTLLRGDARKCADSGKTVASVRELFGMEMDRAQGRPVLIVPSGLAPDSTATLFIEYTNVSSQVMAAPLLLLSPGDAEASGKPLLTLDASPVKTGLWASSSLPEGFSTSLQIIASGTTPGVLQPGETVRIPVYYAGMQQPWNSSNGSVTFSLGMLTADNTAAIDWASLKDGMRPAAMDTEAWNVVWNNLVTQTGATWGSYVTMLDDNAAALGRLGERIMDAGTLLAFEFAQADGLGPVRTLAASVDASLQAPGMNLTFARFFLAGISSRHGTGILGEGWSYNWDYSLATATGGTVTITGPGGTLRTFQPDSQHAGAYIAGTGDYGTLTATGGVYTLTEKDGGIYTFLADGRLDYVQDTNANRITCGYTNGLLTSLTHSAGQGIQIAYNASGRVQTVTDSTGRATTYAYDATGEHLLTVTDYTGDVTTYTYNTTAGSQAENAITSIAYPGGMHEYFTYDS